MAPIVPPLINGNYFDFSSVKIIIANGTQITGFKSINYSSEQAPGDVYGTSRQKLGRTPGQHKASGSFELYRPEFADLQFALQGPAFLNSVNAAAGVVPGLFEVNFSIQVNFSEAPPLGINLVSITPTQTDYILGARITKVDQSHSQGSDALTVKCDFDSMMIYYNNALPINQLLKVGGLTP
jgi:hypothetical protein